MDQLITEQFKRAFIFLLEKEGRGAQTRLAREKDIDRGYLNAIIQGRKKGSENVRSKIANHFQMPYEEMLALGRRLLDTSGQEKERPASQIIEQGSRAEVMPEKRNIPGSGMDLSISNKIRKAIEILEMDSEYRSRFADLIDIFHEALMTRKANADLRIKLEDMEKRIVLLERMLADDAGK